MHRDIRTLSTIIRRSIAKQPLGLTNLDVTEADLGAVRRKKGIDFERHAVTVLSQYGFTLKRSADESSGVLADGGIDLHGEWTFADQLPVAGQCKNLSRSVAVSAIRELESSVQRVAADRGKQVMGLLITSTDLSVPARKWFDQSEVLLSVAILREEHPWCELVFNKTLAKHIPGLSVVRQFNPVFNTFVDVIIKR